jgi:SNF family Na+-dependent transporter
MIKIIDKIWNYLKENITWSEIYYYCGLTMMGVFILFGAYYLKIKGWVAIVIMIAIWLPFIIRRALDDYKKRFQKGAENKPPKK